MKSILELYKYRVKLAQSLRRRGFYVRMHAYEYLLGFKGHLAGVLLLEPRELKATFFPVPNIKDIDIIISLVEDVIINIDPKTSFIIGRRK